MDTGDFGEFAEKPAPAGSSGMSLGTILLWVVSIPFLGFMGVVLASTALITIKPFVERDRLDRPVAVSKVTEKELVLADGRHLSLPLIKRIPKGDPVFQAVLEGGIEVDGRGEAYGLLTVYPSCGMTAYRYVMRKINLSDLAGALDPGGVDASAIDPEIIPLLKERKLAPRTPEKLRDVDYAFSGIHLLRHLREELRNKPPPTHPPNP